MSQGKVVQIIGAVVILNFHKMRYQEFMTHYELPKVTCQV